MRACLDFISGDYALEGDDIRSKWRNLNFDDLPFQEWVHIAIVKTGETLQVYVNGTFIDSRTVAAYTSAMAIWIPRRLANAGSWLHPRISPPDSSSPTVSRSP